MNIYKDVVHKYENFITEEEQKHILSVAKDLNTEWAKSDGYWNDRNTFHHLKIYEELTNRAKKLFSSYSHFDSFCTLQRFRPGESMSIHHDKIGHHLIKYGIVLYLNEDFNGGEIEYPDFGLSIKPKARSLIIHSGDVNHQVKEVLAGPTRYIMTTFVHGTEDKPAILKEDKQ
jgi:hypothetical protein